MTTDPSEARTKPQRCVRCDREIEWCSFCDGEDCSQCLCYVDSLVLLRGSLPPLHPHGG